MLLIVAPKERKVRIEVGRGLEPIVTDLMSTLIIQNAILPAFRRGDFSGGIRAGDARHQGRAARRRRGRQASAPKTIGKAEGPDWLMIVIILFWLAIIVFAIWAQMQPGSADAADRRPAAAARRNRSSLHRSQRRVRNLGRRRVVGRERSGGGGGWSGGGGDFGGGGSSGSW